MKDNTLLNKVREFYKPIKEKKEAENKGLPKERHVYYDVIDEPTYCDGFTAFFCGPVDVEIANSKIECIIVDNETLKMEYKEYHDNDEDLPRWLVLELGFEDDDDYENSNSRYNGKD